MQLTIGITQLTGKQPTMMRISLFLLLGLILFTPAYSCSIDPNPVPFCNYAKRGGLLASGKIIKKIDHGYLIELHTVYRGEETRCEIKVFEQMDGDCNGIIFKYPREILGRVGQVILFTALQGAIWATPAPWYEAGEYYTVYADIKGAGKLMHPMVQKGNKFKGLFAEGVKSVKVEKIVEELTACGIENLLPEPRILCGQIPLHIYPNPTKNEVFIDNLVEAYDEILLYDLNGKIIYRSNKYDPIHGISTKDFNSGLYFVVVKSGSHTFRQKLIINH